MVEQIVWYLVKTFGVLQAHGQWDFIQGALDPCIFTMQPIFPPLTMIVCCGCRIDTLKLDCVVYLDGGIDEKYGGSTVHKTVEICSSKTTLLLPLTV